jgi:hypothetical protein
LSPVCFSSVDSGTPVHSDVETSPRVRCTVGSRALGWYLRAGTAAEQRPLNDMNERFPAEVRATAAAFCYHIGTILGGLVPPVVTYFALTYDLGFSIPMLIGYLIGGGSWCLALYLGPETKGKEMVPDLVLA